MDFQQLPLSERLESLKKALLDAERDCHRLLIDKESAEQILSFSMMKDARDMAAVRLTQVLRDLEGVQARISVISRMITDGDGEH